MTESRSNEPTREAKEAVLQSLEGTECLYKQKEVLLVARLHSPP